MQNFFDAIIVDAGPYGLSVAAHLQTIDRLLFATGYRIDIAKYPFLSPELLSRIDRMGGYPRLKPGLESSVPGLHFLGALAAWSFGPVARFVSGTLYCVQALTRRIANSH